MNRVWRFRQNLSRAQKLIAIRPLKDDGGIDDPISFTIVSPDGNQIEVRRS